MNRILIIIAALAIAFAGASTALAKPGDHCWRHNDKAFVKVNNPGNNRVLPAGTVACVKGGLAEPTTFTADGIQTLGDYLPGKYDVSYVVIYRTPKPTPKPTPTPEATSPPSPKPSATPEPEPSDGVVTPTGRPTLPPTDTN